MKKLLVCCALTGLVSCAPEYQMTALEAQKMVDYCEGMFLDGSDDRQKRENIFSECWFRMERESGWWGFSYFVHDR